jgi:polygalacturonase
MRYDVPGHEYSARIGNSHKALRKRIRDDARIGTMEDVMRTRTRKAIHVSTRGCLFLFVAGTLFGGCSSSKGSSSAAGSPGSGGATHAGGTVSGGSPATTGGDSTQSGGVSLVGGEATSGGTVASGGVTSSAGASSNGGASSVGGATGMGGASSSQTGGEAGAASTGGTPGTGGAASTGGTPGTGGASKTGGSVATGGTSGATKTGGSVGTGGTGASATGGAAGAAGTGGGKDASPPAGDAGVGWNTVDTILARIVAPTFPNLDCDVTKYGGVGDGTTDNTAAFAAAIADCSTKGGGRVVVPAGTFFTGPIEILSNINLNVGTGATLKFSTDATKYLPVVEVSWESSLLYNYHPLIWAHDATNVAITGGGTIDGNATSNDWYAWAGKQNTDQTNLRTQNANGVPIEQRIYGSGHYLRPGLIEFRNCTNILFDGFTAKNSPFWTIHPVLSTNVTATNFTALGSAGNTDGFDPESCTDVLVKNATIQVGDDAIAIKAGRDRDGWTYYKPSQNIVVQNCTLTAKVGGVSMGSEMSAGIRNIYIEDSTFSNSAGNLQYAIYVKAAVTRGGFIEDIYARRLTVATVSNLLYMTGHYVSGAVIGATKYATFSNINIDTATVARTSSSAFLVAGADATALATGISLANITVTQSATPVLSSGSGHYSGLTVSNVLVNGAAFNPPSSAP